MCCGCSTAATPASPSRPVESPPSQARKAPPEHAYPNGLDLCRFLEDDVQTDRRFQRVGGTALSACRWSVWTSLIARHGEPQFCKIDVEGFEHQVLSGLSQPLAALSFEYIPVAAVARNRLRRADQRSRRLPLSTLAGGDAPLGGRGWLEPQAMIEILGRLAEPMTAQGMSTPFARSAQRRNGDLDCSNGLV